MRVLDGAVTEEDIDAMVIDLFKYIDEIKGKYTQCVLAFGVIPEEIHA